MSGLTIGNLLYAVGIEPSAPNDLKRQLAALEAQLKLQFKASFDPSGLNAAQVATKQVKSLDAAYNAAVREDAQRTATAQKSAAQSYTDFWKTSLKQQEQLDRAYYAAVREDAARTASAQKAEEQALAGQIKSVYNEINAIRARFQSGSGNATTQEVIGLRAALEPLIGSANALKIGLAADSAELLKLENITAQATRTMTVAEGGITRLGLSSQVTAGILNSGLMGVVNLLPPQLQGLGSILDNIATQSLPAVAGGAGSATAGLTALNVAAVGSVAALAGVLAIVAASTKAAAQYQQEFAGVTSVLGLSDTEAKALSSSLTSLNTGVTGLPVTSSQINDIAQNAALMGVKGVDGITAFTKSVAELGVISRANNKEMGDLGNTSETLAKFINSTASANDDFVTSLNETKVALGAVDQAAPGTIEQTLQLARFFGSSAKAAGLSRAEIIALSGALVGVGATAEGAGGSLNRIITGMQNAARNGGETLGQFAQIAGTTKQEFAKLALENPAKAMLAFSGGLRAAVDSGEKLSPILEKIHIHSAEDVRTANQLAIGYNSVKATMDAVADPTANAAAMQQRLAEATKTANNANTQFKNTLDKTAQIIGTIFLPALTSGTKGVTGLVEGFNKLLQGGYSSELYGIAAGIAAIGVSLNAVKIGSAVSGLSTALAGISVSAGGAMGAIIALRGAIIATFTTFAPAAIAIGIAALAGFTAYMLADIAKINAATEQSTLDLNAQLLKTAQGRLVLAQGDYNTALEKEKNLKAQIAEITKDGTSRGEVGQLQQLQRDLNDTQTQVVTTKSYVDAFQKAVDKLNSTPQHPKGASGQDGTGDGGKQAIETLEQAVAKARILKKNLADALAMPDDAPGRLKAVTDAQAAWDAFTDTTKHSTEAVKLHQTALNYLSTETNTVKEKAKDAALEFQNWKLTLDSMNLSELQAARATASALKEVAKVRALDAEIKQREAQGESKEARIERESKALVNLVEKIKTAVAAGNLSTTQALAYKQALDKLATSLGTLEGGLSKTQQGMVNNAKTAIDQSAAHYKAAEAAKAHEKALQGLMKVIDTLALKGKGGLIDKLAHEEEKPTQKTVDNLSPAAQAQYLKDPSLIQDPARVKALKDQIAVIHGLEADADKIQLSAQRENEKASLQVTIDAYEERKKEAKGNLEQLLQIEVEYGYDAYQARQGQIDLDRAQALEDVRQRYADKFKQLGAGRDPKIMASLAQAEREETTAINARYDAQDLAAFNDYNQNALDAQANYDGKSQQQAQEHKQRLLEQARDGAERRLKTLQDNLNASLEVEGLSAAQRLKLIVDAQPGILSAEQDFLNARVAALTEAENTRYDNEVALNGESEDAALIHQNNLTDITQDAANNLTEFTTTYNKNRLAAQKSAQKDVSDLLSSGAKTTAEDILKILNTANGQERDSNKTFLQEKLAYYQAQGEAGKAAAQVIIDALDKLKQADTDALKSFQVTALSIKNLVLQLKSDLDNLIVTGEEAAARGAAAPFDTIIGKAQAGIDELQKKFDTLSPSDQTAGRVQFELDIAPLKATIAEAEANKAKAVAKARENEKAAALARKVAQAQTESELADLDDTKTKTERDAARARYADALAAERVYWEKRVELAKNGTAEEQQVAADGLRKTVNEQNALKAKITGVAVDDATGAREAAKGSDKGSDGARPAVSSRPPDNFQGWIDGIARDIAGSSGSLPEIAKLEKEITDLQTAISKPGVNPLPGTKEKIQDLLDQIAVLKQSISELQDSGKGKKYEGFVPDKGSITSPEVLDALGQVIALNAKINGGTLNLEENLAVVGEQANALRLTLEKMKSGALVATPAQIADVQKMVDRLDALTASADDANDSMAGLANDGDFTSPEFKAKLDDDQAKLDKLEQEKVAAEDRIARLAREREVAAGDGSSTKDQIDLAKSQIDILKKLQGEVEVGSDAWLLYAKAIRDAEGVVQSFVKTMSGSWQDVAKAHAEAAKEEQKHEELLANEGKSRYEQYLKDRLEIQRKALDEGLSLLEKAHKDEVAAQVKLEEELRKKHAQGVADEKKALDDKLTAKAKDLENVAGGKLDTFGQGKVDALNLNKQKLDAGIISQDEYKTSLNDTITALENQATAYEKAGLHATGLRIEIAKLREEEQQLTEQLDKATKKLLSEFEKDISAIKQGLSAVDSILSANKKEQDVLHPQNANEKALQDRADQIENIHSETIKANAKTTLDSTADIFSTLVPIAKPFTDLFKSIGGPLIDGLSGLVDGLNELLDPAGTASRKAAAWGQAFAESLASGISSGISSGIFDAVKSGDYKKLSDVMQKSIGESVLKAMIDAFVQTELIKDIIQPALEKYGRALKTADPNDDAAALEGLVNAGNTARGITDAALPGFQAVSDAFGVTNKKYGSTGQAQLPTLQTSLPPSVQAALGTDFKQFGEKFGSSVDRFGNYVNVFGTHIDRNGASTTRFEQAVDKWIQGSNDTSSLRYQTLRG